MACPYTASDRLGFSKHQNGGPCCPREVIYGC
nr:MAG TPA: hypothetical protein [Caudoviricetes sp.]